MKRPEDLIGSVDAVILARDDHERHREMAAPFLEAGLPIFVDKPLTLSRDDLEFFRPFLEKGKLMSGSAMRFATELDAVRAEIGSYGQVKLIRGAVVNDWARYGVHMLEAILPLLRSKPLAVAPHAGTHESVAITTEDGTLVLVDVLGDVPKTFRVDIFGTKRVSSHEIADNFGMFRRMLWQFAEMIRTGRPSIPVEDTLGVLQVLIAGRSALQEQKDSATRAVISRSGFHALSFGALRAAFLRAPRLYRREGEAYSRPGAPLSDKPRSLHPRSQGRNDWHRNLFHQGRP